MVRARVIDGVAARMLQLQPHEAIANLRRPLVVAAEQASEVTGAPASERAGDISSASAHVVGADVRASGVTSTPARGVRASEHTSGVTSAPAHRAGPSEQDRDVREGSSGAPRVRYTTDNMGVRKYIQDGGGRALRLNQLVKDIWLWLLQRGARLDVDWVSGATMVSNGVDALSRSKNEIHEVYPASPP